MSKKTLQVWLAEYGESHQNPTNKVIHHIAVPLIMFSTLGLLYCLPIPFEGSSRPLNWASLAAVAALMFYARLSQRLFWGMLAVVVLQLCVFGWMNAHLGVPPWGVFLAIFVAAWVLQLWGHQIEGKKPSFFKDLQFLLIGPVWVLEAIYQKLGVVGETD